MTFILIFNVSSKLIEKLTTISSYQQNLLRTDDGKLCILDFGMTIQTPEDLQYALLEFIAHLTSGNYDALPQDLVHLHFIKQEKLQLILDLGVLEPMIYFFKQAANGGGTSKIRDRVMDGKL